MYHGVTRAPLAPYCWHQTDLASFRRQMAWVSRGYRVLPLTEALDRLGAGTLPRRSLALTFDDGYRNVVTNVFPVLKDLGLPATVFLVTAFVGSEEILWPDRLYLAFARTSASDVDLTSLGLGRRGLVSAAARGLAYEDGVRALKLLPRAEKEARLAALLDSLGQAVAPPPGDFRLLTWEDVHRLAATGLVDFAAHSTHHEILSRLPDDEVVSQITDSHLELSRRLGRSPRVFAYPNGRAKDFDVRARATIDRLGISYALSTIEWISDATTDRLALRRVGVGAGVGFSEFTLQVSGLHEAVGRSYPD
jgi:peptidoglycan/xylan/chitin deacetylase (PgdA/CDA1 family)